jgi:indolepyruvate ferredoxin oxidoreductase beta subunit
MQLIIAGRGGQGILLLTRILGETASQSGHPVLSSETHGMALRGGSVVTHLKVGSYRSPLIAAGSADVVIGMDEEEAGQNTHFLRENGTLIINHSKNGNGRLAIDADHLALGMGNMRLSNMILLGFVASRLNHHFPPAVMKATIRRVSPGTSSDQNVKAFELGWEKGCENPAEECQ